MPLESISSFCVGESVPIPTLSVLASQYNKYGSLSPFTWRSIFSSLPFIIVILFPNCTRLLLASTCVLCLNSFILCLRINLSELSTLNLNSDPAIFWSGSRLNANTLFVEFKRKVLSVSVSTNSNWGTEPSLCICRVPSWICNFPEGLEVPMPIDPAK